MARLTYTPGPPPQNPEGLSLYLHRELIRISQFISDITEVFGANMFDSAPGSTQNLSTTYVDVSSFDASTIEKGIVVDESSAMFTLDRTGTYLITYTATVSADANNTTVVFGISEDGGSPVTASETAIFLKSSAETGTVTGSFLVEAFQGSTAALQVKSTAGTPQITYNGAVFSIVEQT